jgi:hypothetical protein
MCTGVPQPAIEALLMVGEKNREDLSRSDFLQQSRSSKIQRWSARPSGAGLGQPSSGLPEVVLSMGGAMHSSAEVRMKGVIDDLQITYRGQLWSHHNQAAHPR